VSRGSRIAVRSAVLVAIGAFLYVYLAKHWNELRHAGDALDLHAGPLLAAAAIILGTYGVLIAAWDAVLRGWDQRLPYRDAAAIWCVSNLARYIPGRVWQIAGMAALAQRAGVSPWAAAGSAIVVQLLAISTGTLVTFIFAPALGSPLLIVVAGLGTAGAAAALTWPAGAAAFTRLIRRLTGRQVELRPVRPGPLAVAAGVTALAWIFYGVALYLSVRGLTGRTVDLRTAIGVFTGSYVAGLVNPLLPAGLGTREIILVNWLTGPLGSSAASLVTAGSRLLMTVTEIAAALLTLPLLTPRTDARQA